MKMVMNWLVTTYLNTEHEVVDENGDEWVGDEVLEVSHHPVRRPLGEACPVHASPRQAGPSVDVGSILESRMRSAFAVVFVLAANAAGVGSAVASAAQKIFRLTIRRALSQVGAFSLETRRACFEHIIKGFRNFGSSNRMDRWTDGRTNSPCIHKDKVPVGCRCRKRHRLNDIDMMLTICKLTIGHPLMVA